MNTTNQERRFFNSVIRTESTGGKRYLRGTAIVYHSRSQNLGGFKEKILPGAATKTLRNSDLRFLYDHDSANLLGRESAGTLTVSEDMRGVHFRVELPQTSVADDVFELCQRRDLTGCSFAMRVQKESWIDEPDDDEEDDEEDTQGYSKRSPRMIPVRCVQQLELLELSAVSFPAYAATSVSAAERSRLLFPSGVPAPIEAELRSRGSGSRQAPTVAELKRKIAAMDLTDLISAEEQRQRLKMRLRLMALDL